LRAAALAVAAARTRSCSAPASISTPSGASKPVLLSGGNPQIPKGDGDGPVQAYIAALPGWKQDIGRQLDELITAAVPGVRKAVKWNSPFYGADDQTWFMSFHAFNLSRRAGERPARRGPVYGLGETGGRAAGRTDVTIRPR
jgi:Domain of unknown function (DU1801)